MTAHFPKAKGKTLGYRPDQVDELISKAREQFADPAKHLLEHGKLRHSAFDLAPGGYLISAVDAALERLDDAFAVQEVKRTLLESGHHELDLQVSRLTVLLQGRIERKAGRRFARLKVWHRGYSHNQVDKLCLRLGQKLGPQDSFDLNELRSAEFKASWGGYAENQVDAFIDRAVELSQIKSVLAN